MIPLVSVVLLVASVLYAAEEAPALPALSAPLEAALGEADAERDRYVEEWIRITGIPAPSGAEEERARHVRGEFERTGAGTVRTDSAGNVICRLPGRDPSLASVAFIAHLDTVAPASADHRVKRQGTRLLAPGVRDNSSGVAGLLAALDLMARHGLRPETDTYLVASTREETGLHGARHFVEEHRQELGAVVAVDGTLGQISYAATGIAWLKLHFLAPGAHTLKARDEPSAILAAARAIERISAIPLRRSPEEMETWLNIGMIGGGEVPNAQPRDVWFTVDVRSNDHAGFESLRERLLEIGRSTAGEVGVAFEHETTYELVGARLAGAEDSPLVRSARQVLETLGWSPIHLTPRGTADHNVAIALGIPGIAIGMTTGEGAHTPGEWADIEPFAVGVKQILLLATRPLTDRKP